MLLKKTGVKFQIKYNYRFDCSFLRIHKSEKIGVIRNSHVINITPRDFKRSPIEISRGLFFNMIIRDFEMAHYLANRIIVEVFR